MHVDIKLVGFHGDGNNALKVEESELGRYLKVLDAQLGATVIHSRPGEPHKLPFSSQFYYRVIRAPKSLTEKVYDVIKAFAVRGKQVPTEEMDKVRRCRPDAASNEANRHMSLSGS